MGRTVSKTKVEYGDFQTPIELAKQVCQKLVELGISPDVVIEPTCGMGSFIEAASQAFQSVREIIGFEINTAYLEEVRAKNRNLQDGRITLQYADFFQFDWKAFIDRCEGKILVLGNLPWVTNSQQGSINGGNLPKKSNFQHHNGLDALTGKSNFDISEWMLIQIVQWLQARNGEVAMLCKTAVARKLLKYIYSKKFNLAHCAAYRIDAKRYFNADVDACLLICRFDTHSTNYFCDVFRDFESSEFDRIGYHRTVLVRDTARFDQTLYNATPNAKWRSGIKHDCSSVMEFRKVDQYFVNGLGESVELEDTYLFPLLKGSDVAQNRFTNVDRYVLVTQKSVGESTEQIERLAPKTWHYLQTHAQYLDNRKSRIYQDSPRFSIFGVGVYTFEPWKIAICGLYKKLEFQLIGKINDHPAVFDDTVYFLSFSDKETARKIFALLTSKSAIDFYSSLIFWDEKRPIKSSVLNSLNLSVLAAREFLR